MSNLFSSGILEIAGLFALGWGAAHLTALTLLSGEHNIKPSRFFTNWLVGLIAFIASFALIPVYPAIFKAVATVLIIYCLLTVFCYSTSWSWPLEVMYGKKREERTNQKRS